MPTFKYKAKKGPKEVVEGKVEAKDEAEAIEKISQMDYIPIKVEGHAASAGLHKPDAAKTAGGKVRSREITIFSRQLASLCQYCY